MRDFEPSLAVLSLRARCIACVCVARAQAFLYVVCSSEAGCFLCNNRRGRRWRRALSCCAPDALWRAGIGHEVVGLRALLLRHRSRKLRLLVRLKRRELSRSSSEPNAPAGLSLVRACFGASAAFAPGRFWPLVGAEVPPSTSNVNRSLPLTLFDAKTDDGTREAPRIAWIRSRERFCRTKRHRRRSSRPARDLQNHSDRLGAVGFRARSCAITSVA